MIKNKKLLSMSEALMYIKGKGKEEDKAKNFIKKFIKLKA